MEQICRLVGYRFQCCTYNMISVRPPAYSYNGSSCIRIPVRSTQPDKCGNNINTVRVINLIRHPFRINRTVYYFHFVSEPLYGSPCNKNRAFQRIMYFPVDSPSNGGQKSVIGVHRCLSRIHQKKTSSAIGTLCFTFCKTGLSEKSSLLISRRTAYVDRPPKNGWICLSINLTGPNYLRQHSLGNIQLL